MNRKIQMLLQAFNNVGDLIINVGDLMASVFDPVGLQLERDKKREELLAKFPRRTKELTFGDPVLDSIEKKLRGKKDSHMTK